ncbi:MAG: hypothetical protein J5855_00890 [Mailhella sp.]|nr:hypothetical protein [Mailhella sp.]
MKYFPLLCAILLIVGGALCVMPFLCLSDRFAAAAQKRSVFEKSASQLAVPAGIALMLLAAALAADIYAVGSISRICALSQQTPVLLGCGTACAAAAGLLLTAGGRLKKTAPYALAAIAGGAALLSSVFLSGVVTRGRVPASWADFAAEPSFMGLWAGFCVFSAFFFAENMAVLWYGLRRGKDDFGRDYYTAMPKRRSWRGVFFGISTLIFGMALLFTAQPSVPRGAVFPWTSFALESADAVRTWLLSGSLGMPLAVFLQYLTARSSSPMRFRFLSWLSGVLWCASVFCLIAVLF